MSKRVFVLYHHPMPIAPNSLHTETRHKQTTGRGKAKPNALKQEARPPQFDEWSSG